MKISAVISTYNNEKTLAKTLESIKWVDEIVVVDHQSVDKTVEIARKYGAVVYSEKNDPAEIDFQKNFGFGKAKGDWVLSIDSDEQTSNELQKEIKTVIESGEYVGYKMPRKNIIFGKWIENSIWWPDYQLRLFQKGKGEYKKGNVHQEIYIDGKIGQLQNPLDHDNYTSISQFIQKMDVYTSVEADNAIEKKEKSFLVAAISRPAEDFLKTFFLQKGYRDGFHGFALSVLQSFYAFLIVLKIWEKQGFKEENGIDFLYSFTREVGKIYKDLSYWLLTTRIDSTQNKAKKIFYKIKRKNV